jgi:uncharacterized protein (TIGR02268 family)
LFQSAPLAVVLVLLGGTLAPAQAPARAQRQRSVTVTGDSSEPPPEVHVSPETPTVLLFSVDIRKQSVRVDEARIRVVDASEQALIVRAVEPLGEGERVGLEVQFADGKVPARFALVPPASEVDTLINVTRREPLAPPCPAEVTARVRRPEDLLLLDYMGKSGVQTAEIKYLENGTHGFASEGGTAYRGKGWLLLDVKVRDLQGPQPWVPTEAALVGKAGAKLPGRVVAEGQGEPTPSGGVRVLVVTEEPHPSAGLVFTLELSGADGRSLAFPPVKIPELPKKRGKP